MPDMERLTRSLTLHQSWQSSGPTERKAKRS